MSTRFLSFARLLGLSALLMGLSIGCDGSSSGSAPPPIEVPRPDAERSTVEVSRAQGVVADGQDASTLTVTVRRAGGEPVGGQRVRLEVSGEGATATPAEGYTDASGVWTAALTATAPGAKTVKVSVMAAGGAVVLKSQATVTFTGTDSAPVATKLAFATTALSATAGSPVVPALEVAIQDAQGNVVAGAAHDVTLALGAHPDGAALEGTVTAKAVNGVARFPEVVLKRAGTGYTLVASAAGLASATSAAFDVVPSAAAALTLQASAQSVTAGEAVGLTVTVGDAFGNVATNYVGTVQLSSPDATAVLPVTEYSFTAADAGRHTFEGLVFNRAGTAQVTVTEKALGALLQKTADVGVLPGPAAKLGLAGGAGPYAAGTSFSVEVVAYDAFDNVATGYQGTIHFSASDSAAILPADHPFTAADAGRRTFDVVLKTAGTVSLTVTDAADGSLTKSSSVQVQPGSPATLAFISGPGNGTVRAALGAVRVALRDLYGNATTATTPDVSLALKGGSASAILSGTTTVTPVNGEATFSNLSVDLDGTGYQLTATATELPSQGSALFNISDNLAPSAPVLSFSATSSSITLTWTAVGDDADQGTAVAYELRYATSAITNDDEFGAATAVATSAPKAARSAESVTVSGLTPESAYHFALKVRDNAGNLSPLATVSASTGDLCAGVTCEPSTTAPTCAADGISRVTYTSACVVENNAAKCVDQPQPTACTGTDAVCFAGACDTAAAPAAGELFITEVMHSPSASTTEYIELVNPAQKLLNLNGLTVTFTEGAASRSFTVDVGAGNALVIGKAGTFVLAQVKDEASNGGVKADYGYGTDFTLSGTGQLTLASGATTVESLSYDVSFPQTSGTAMNVSSAVAGTSANQRSWYWCDSTASLSGGDLGSPNAPNDACGMAVTAPLDYCRIQYPKTIASMNVGDSVTVYSQFWEPSVTDRKKGANDFYPYLVAEVGFGTDKANPGSWTWKAASYNAGYSNGTADDDEMQGGLSIGTGGDYFYGYRYRMVDPATGAASADVYCDQNGVPSDFATASWGTVTVSAP